jgi:hypothetical protein
MQRYMSETEAEVVAGAFDDMHINDRAPDFSAELVGNTQLSLSHVVLQRQQESVLDGRVSTIEDES